MALFVSPNRLTLFIPPADTFGLVSLEGFEFQVLIDGQTRTYALDAFTSFQLPSNMTPAPACFTLLLSGANPPMPLECNGVSVFRQELAPSNQFWYDSLAFVIRNIVIATNGVPVSVCPSGESECPFTYVPPVVSPPTATPTSEPITFEMVDSLFEFLSSYSEFPSLTFQYPEGWSRISLEEPSQTVVLLSIDIGEIPSYLQIAEIYEELDFREAILNGEFMIAMGTAHRMMSQFSVSEAEDAYAELGLSPSDFENERLARAAVAIWAYDEPQMGIYRQFGELSTSTFDVIRLYGGFSYFQDDQAVYEQTELIFSIYLLKGEQVADSVILAMTINRIDQREVALATLDAIMLSMEVVPATQG